VLSSLQSGGPLKRQSMDRELNQINVIPLIDIMLERLVTVVDRIGTFAFSRVSLEVIRV
jgi:biopolymer transport protein ExbD